MFPDEAMVELRSVEIVIEAYERCRCEFEVMRGETDDHAELLSIASALDRCDAVLVRQKAQARRLRALASPSLG